MPEKTPAETLTASIRAGWNLGNTLDALLRGAKPGEWVSPRDAETAWRNPPATRDLMCAVRDAGFDAVRLPVTWAQHMDLAGRVDPAWLDRVAEGTGYVLDEGMVCLVNVHHDAGAHGWLQATAPCHDAFGERFEGLWRQIAARFCDTGEKLVFEAFNEMLDGRENWSQTPDASAYAALDRWNRRFVDTVRASGGSNSRRLLSLQTYSAGNTPRTLEAFRLPPDPAPGRLILQTHTYDPQDFCWLQNKLRPSREDWGTSGDEREADLLTEALAAFSLRVGAPVMIGEFGSEDKRNPSQRAGHASYWVHRAREKGIPCFWWDCGAFALFDRAAARPLQPALIRALTAG